MQAVSAGEAMHSQGDDVTPAVKDEFEQRVRLKKVLLCR